MAAACPSKHRQYDAEGIFSLGSVQIVEVLETLAGDRRDEQVERLAQHALRGQVWDKALMYFRQAGAKAFARSAHREAVECLEQALEALAHLPPDHSTLEQAIDVRCDMHHALTPFAQWERDLTYLREAETLAAGLADQRRLGRVYRRMPVALVNVNMQDYEAALAYGQRAHAIGIALGDVDFQVEVNIHMGRIDIALGDYHQALEYLQQPLSALQGERRFQSLGSVAFLPAVNARIQMMECCKELGRFADGVAYGAEALQIAEEGNRPYDRLSVYIRLGRLHVAQGTLHTAIPMLERAVALGQDANIPNLYRFAASWLALAYALAGRAADTLSLLGQVEGNSFVRAEASLRAGDVEETHRLAQRRLADARYRKERGQEARALWLLGEIAMHRDSPDVAQAEAHYQQALALAEELGMRPLVAHCHHGLGRLYCQTGGGEQARAVLTAADLYRAMDMTFWLPQAEAALAQVEGQ